MEMEIRHNGTEISFNLLCQPDRLIVEHLEKTLTILPEQGKSFIFAFPSVEGTVIIAELNTGKSVFYNSLTGLLLAKEDIGQNRISVYAEEDIFD